MNEHARLSAPTLLRRMACLAVLAGILIFSSGGGSAAPGPIKITLWHRLAEQQHGVLDELADRFNDRHSNIIVDIVNEGWSFAEFDEAVTTAIASRRPPTMAVLYDQQICAHAADLLPLDSRLTDEEKADVVGGLRSPYGENETIVSVPLLDQVQVLYYIEELVPDPPSTWGEYIESARGSTVDSDGDGVLDLYGTGFRPQASPDQFLVFLLQAGGDIIDHEGASVILGNAAGVAAAAFLQDLAPYSLVTDEYLDMHIESLAMWIDTYAAFPYCRESADAAGVTLRTALVPGAGTGASLIQGRSLVVFSDVRPEEADAAVLFLRFLLEPESTAYLASQLGYLPVTYSGHESPSWVQHIASNEPAAVASQQMLQSARVLLHPEYDELRKILGKMCEAVMVDDVPSGDAISAASDEIAVLLGVPNDADVPAKTTAIGPIELCVAPEAADVDEASIQAIAEGVGVLCGRDVMGRVFPNVDELAAYVRSAPERTVALLSELQYLDLFEATDGNFAAVLASRKSDEAAPYYFTGFYAARDSGLRSIEDCEGMRWVYAHRGSTSAYRLPQAAFEALGVSPGSEIEAESHTAAITLLAEEQADFCTAYGIGPIPPFDSAESLWSWGDDPERGVWDRSQGQLLPEASRWQAGDARLAAEWAGYEDIWERIGIFYVAGPLPTGCIAVGAPMPRSVRTSLVIGLQQHIRSEEGALLWGDLDLFGSPWPGLAPADDTLFDVLRAMYGYPASARDEEFSWGYSSIEGLVPAGNVAPTAAFEWEPISADGTRLVVEPRTGDAIRFDASVSSDPDGEIVAYSWDWTSDGAIDETTNGPEVEHWYDEAGTYEVSLEVVDDIGAIGRTSETIIIGERHGPKAGFGYSPSEPTVLDDVGFIDESSDKDGAIVSWVWEFGDGTTSAERHPAHRYGTKGSHTVTLTVIDDEGQSDTETRVVTVVNLSPTARFEPGRDRVVVGGDVVLDASASSDPDGEIVTYAWDFDGDGTIDKAATEPQTSYRFSASVVHEVTLLVTDDSGATDVAIESIAVDAGPEIIEPPEVWALVIGISDYREVKDLEYARADAEAFARWLLDAGVDREHLMLLLDEAGEHAELDGVRSELATLVQVRAGLGWLRRMAEPDDLVFVYFAGHGYPGPDDDGDEADGVDEFLVLWDTLNASKEETALRDDEFGAFLDRVESDHVMVIFDSCYSGGASRSLSSGARPLGDTFDLFNDFSLEGKLVFAAAREDQEALEHAALGHGIFTHFLILGLEGAADLDADYLITAEELDAYVVREVAEFARTEKGREQTPEMTGRGEMGIVLGRTNRPPVAAFDIEPDVPYAHGEARFVDGSIDDETVVSWSWAFGDGAVSGEESPRHAYDRAGVYVVSLTVTDADGASSTIEREVVIAAPGEVTAIAGDTVVVSLGLENGIEVGDRLDVVRVLALSSGREIVERKATIEIIEVLGIDRAACRIVEQRFPIELRDVLWTLEHD